VKEEEKKVTKELPNSGRKLDNSIFRKLDSWKEGNYKQT
jgi:hypothetical protein